MPKGGEDSDSTLVPLCSLLYHLHTHTIIPFQSLPTAPYLEQSPLPAPICVKYVSPIPRGVQWVLGMVPEWDGVGAGCTARELVVQRIPTYRMV
jgi:hypothetical protein